MNPNSAIKKYYVGFAVLMVLMVGALVYTFAQAGAAKTDRATNTAVEKISTKLGYGTSVPDSLATAGVADVPDTIKYTKLSDSQYKICITYKQSSGIFDAGWTSLIGGAFIDASSDSSSSNSSEYFDSSVEFKHKKGENCQTVKPYSYSYDDSSYYNDSTSPESSVGGSSSSSSTACLSGAKASASLYLLDVSSIDTVNKTIHFESSGSAPTAPKTYDSETIFCNTNFAASSSTSGYTVTDISAVKPGDNVTIYLKNDTDTNISELDINN